MPEESAADRLHGQDRPSLHVILRDGYHGHSRRVHLQQQMRLLIDCSNVNWPPARCADATTFYPDSGSEMKTFFAVLLLFVSSSAQDKPRTQVRHAFQRGNYGIAQQGRREGVKF